MGIIFRLGLFATGLILCIGEDCLNESQMRGDLFLSPSISAGTSKSKSLRWQLFHDRVSAVFLPAAIPAPEPCPYRVEVVHCRSDERRVVREDARLEVAPASGFHSHACAREVGRAYVGLLPVEYEDLEVHPRAEGPLQPSEEGRIPVEFLPEDWSRFLGVQEPHAHTLADQLREDSEERQAVGTHLDVQVLYVRSPYPEG